MNIVVLLSIACVGQLPVAPLPMVTYDRWRTEQSLLRSGVGVYCGGNDGIEQPGGRSVRRNQGTESQRSQLDFHPAISPGHHLGDSNPGAKDSGNHRTGFQSDRQLQASAGSASRETVNLPRWTSGVVSFNSGIQSGEVITYLPQAGPGYVPPCFT